MNIKNKGVLAIAVAMIIGSVSAPVFAVAEQGSKDVPIKEGRMPPPPKGHHDNWKVFEGLDLTQDQKDKIKDFIKSSRESQRDVFKDGIKYNKELRDLSASDDYSRDKAESLAEDGAKVLTKAAVERAEVDNKIYNVLTDEQKAKYKDNLKKRDETFKEKLNKMKDGGREVPPPQPEDLR